MGWEWETVGSQLMLYLGFVDNHAIEGGKRLLNYVMYGDNKVVDNEERDG